MTNAVVGQIVNYRLKEAEATNLNAGRNTANERAGNTCHEGDIVPMIVVRVWPDEYPDSWGVNGQAFLDGNDSLWVTSAREGTEPGQWQV